MSIDSSHRESHQTSSSSRIHYSEKGGLLFPKQVPIQLPGTGERLSFYSKTVRRCAFTSAERNCRGPTIIVDLRLEFMEEPEESGESEARPSTSEKAEEEEEKQHETSTSHWPPIELLPIMHGTLQPQPKPEPDPKPEP